MNIGVIGDRHTVEAFRLIGVSRGCILRDPGDDAAVKALGGRFDELTKEGAVAVILITETARRLISERIDYYSKFKPLFPLIISIPDISGEDTEVDHLSRLIERAVGISLENVDQ